MLPVLCLFVFLKHTWLHGIEEENTGLEDEERGGRGQEDRKMIVLSEEDVFSLPLAKISSFAFLERTQPVLTSFSSR